MRNGEANTELWRRFCVCTGSGGQGPAATQSKRLPFDSARAAQLHLQLVCGTVKGSGGVGQGLRCPVVADKGAAVPGGAAMCAGSPG